jgi:hypothetical protein
MPGSRPGRNPARIYRIVDYHTVLCAPLQRRTPLVRYASQKGQHAELRISAKKLGKTIECFFTGASGAIALDNAEFLFDFSTARYSVTGEGGCVLHIWSEERNSVQRVTDVKSRLLRLSVLRFGQSQPTILEICADQRSATARRAIRARYTQVFGAGSAARISRLPARLRQ